MTRGAQDAMARQTTELSGENAQLKEELAFLQKLVSDSSKTVGLQIQRVAVEPDGEDMWRYSLLVVRGGSPKDEFVGTVALQATIAADPATHAPLQVIQLPEDDPAAAPALTLKFKYYQRVEGRFRVPPGRRVTAVAVRAYEAGQGSAARDADLDLGIGGTMFERKKHAPPQKRIDCLIGAGTTVQGDVTFTGGLRIDGIVRGNVTTANGEIRHAGRQRAGARRRRDQGFARGGERDGQWPDHRQ